MVAGLKRESPELGTILGLPDAQHALVQDNSIEGGPAEGEEDAWHKRLMKIDATALEGTDAGVIHGFLKELLESSIGSRVCKAELWSVDQIGGWQVRMASWRRCSRWTPGSCGPMRCSASRRSR